MEEKIYFMPGDLCQVRHDIEFKPVMWVADKVSRLIKNKETSDPETMFIGIKCRWFNTNGELQEAIFNTKDLILIED